MIQCIYNHDRINHYPGYDQNSSLQLGVLTKMRQIYERSKMQNMSMNKV